MKRPMADVAVGALERGVRDPGGETPGPRRVHLDEGPVAADTWTDGDLGFVLLLHRRDDGFAAGEVYSSLKGEDHRWTEAEHLSGGVVGFDIEDPSAVERILSGALLLVLSESESRVFTGHSGDDGDELVRLYEILVSSTVGALRIERNGPVRESGPAVFRKSLTSCAAVVAVRPGERLRVVPVQRGGSASPAVSHGLDLFSASE
ncbi:hypothetical protein [Streptomyces sp. H51]|uniref:hypothetical protein n=1 Tax=Streptomyces sp. H51 TaxID=3111770 RepID=UPI002D77B25D|nr:hypothetical protein [Streptomyces sp. H51]